MFENYLSSIKGIDIYPIISILAFFLFFVLMAAWILSARKDFIKTMSSLPLNNDELVNPDPSFANRINHNDKN